MNPPALSSTPASTTARLIEKYLACPRSHAPLRVEGDQIACAESGFIGTIRDEVAVMMPLDQPSFFDDKFLVMQSGHENEGERTFCYAQQAALLTSYFRPGQVVLDIGCGPSLPYSKPEGAFVIGLEPSFRSVRVNQQVDLRVCGSATAIPLTDSSVDIVICFYSIHHMVGATKAETAENVANAFREFGRVLKPQGILFVFEMTPITPFAWFQALVWNQLRRAAPGKLDMYFWSAKSLSALAEKNLPRHTLLEKIYFETSIFTTFPPAFNFPWFRVPRLIYPLDAKLYKWRVAPAPLKAGVPK
jgi:SAM-dependent methyltransferase